MNKHLHYHGEVKNQLYQSIGHIQKKLMNDIFHYSKHSITKLFKLN
jgi:hypothetical protein